MTVEEYADACEALGVSIDDLDSLDEFSSGWDVIEDANAEIKEWDPPEELQEFHEVRVRGFELLVDGLKDVGYIDLMEDFEKAAAGEGEAKTLELMSKFAELEDEMAELADEAVALEDKYNRTKEELSPATREILADADCL